MIEWQAQKRGLQRPPATQCPEQTIRVQISINRGRSVPNWRAGLVRQHVMVATINNNSSRAGPPA